MGKRDLLKHNKIKGHVQVGFRAYSFKIFSGFMGVY